MMRLKLLLKLLLKPEWRPAFQDHLVRWLNKKLPANVQAWLRKISGKTPFLSKVLLMKAAEEMFIRDLFTSRDLVKLESNLGGAHYPAALMGSVVDFIESGDWKDSNAGWDKRRKELLLCYTDTHGGPGGSVQTESARTAPPRTKPLKGSKAAEQQCAGHPKSRSGSINLTHRARMQKRLDALKEEWDEMMSTILSLQDDIDGLEQEEQTAWPR